MSNIFETETKIKQIIDELKALSAQAGLANQGEEERIITSVFLYKFLNDKFMYNLSKFAEEIGETIEEILKTKMMSWTHSMTPLPVMWHSAMRIPSSTSSTM